MYETKPVLRKLKTTLLGSGALLLLSSTLLFGLIETGSSNASSGNRLGAERMGPRQVSRP